MPILNPLIDSYRESVLNAYMFDNIDDVREITADWIADYNSQRPHDALGGLSPKMYREKNNKINGLRYASATPSLHCDHSSLNNKTNMSTLESY
jgi:putative transposase